MNPLRQGLWPRSLRGQLLLAIALALLLAQGISAALLWRAQAERREAAVVHAAALRLFAATRDDRMHDLAGPHPPELIARAEQLRVDYSAATPLGPGDHRLAHGEEELREILTEQGVALGQVMVFHRPIAEDSRIARRVFRRGAVLGEHAPPLPRDMLVAAIQPAGTSGWMIVHTPAPSGERALLVTLLGQTLLTYALLVGASALIIGRIARPLAALTNRLERFAATRDAGSQLEPQGPEDMRRLIRAHNAMEDRIAGLLDEKDVMLGAIGHDLKTPLAALRVRIESVEDEAERAKMALTIEDIARSLDDILSLARVGRPSDPLEPVELSALVGQVAEEFEDLGQPVSFAPAERLVMPLRATWLRRALRNLVSNSLRYGQIARITLERQGDQAVIRVEDDGPGIPAGRIAQMFQPFTRGEPSRNSETGGAGLGLALARAIAEQHGGTLTLANRVDASGAISGLTATLALPI